MADRVPGGGDDAETQEAFEYDVFLSFASADQAVAEAIFRTLKQGGLKVFWAPDSLRAGQRFFQVIAESVIKSRHFVLYWTAGASSSHWVAEEYETFFNQCYVKSRGARQLIVLPDGRESTSTLPSLLLNRQFARSAEEVLKQLDDNRAATRPHDRRNEGPPPVHPGSPWRPPEASPTDPPAGTAIEGPLGMRMRFVPGGTYAIGSPESEPGRDGDEILHEVQLTRSFWLGETPVTQGQWNQLVPGPKQPSHFKSGGDDLPVESINWYEAVEFANRLSEHEGLPRCYELLNPKGTLDGGEFICDNVVSAGLDCPGYRLPTEAEWEVTARAGVDPAKGTPPDLDAVAWYQANAEGTTHPIGQKASNSWGFHDLLGNVFEWTGDRYGDYSKGRAVDPLGPLTGLNRVRRGGSWDSFAREVRAAYRYHLNPLARWYDLGFRLARGQSAL